MILITEKSDKISWDEVHNVLWEAHAANRAKGVVMSFPSLPGEKLHEKIVSGGGKMFVALDGAKVIGTAAFTIVPSKRWFCKGKYTYLCLASVLPDYRNQGIYKKLCDYREESFRNNDTKIVVFETHERNTKVISIQEKQGFHKVSYKRCKDGHYNVIMAKWIDKCPFSSRQIKVYFICSKMKTLLKSIL